LQEAKIIILLTFNYYYSNILFYNGLYISNHSLLHFFMIVDISIIIPIRNEEGNIVPLAQEIEKAMATTLLSWECIWINDGSNDQSLVEIQTLVENENYHRCITFLENRGQSVALWYGFQSSRGQILVTLDGDRQNDPADIPKLVELIKNDQADIANGYREKRKDSWKRKLSSRIANSIRNYITGTTVRDIGCSIRAIKRECVVNLPLFVGVHRFLPTLMSYHGYRIVEQPVNHRPRQLGTSNYSIHNRLWVSLFDLFGVYWLKHRGFCSKWDYKEIKMKHSIDLPIVHENLLSNSHPLQFTKQLNSIKHEGSSFSNKP